MRLPVVETVSPPHHESGWPHPLMSTTPRNCGLESSLPGPKQSDGRDTVAWSACSQKRKGADRASTALSILVESLLTSQTRTGLGP